MTVKLFNEIKDAEKKAEEIIAKGELDKEKIIQEAKHKSIVHVEKGEEKIDKEKETKIESKREKAESARTEVLSKGKEDIQKLKQNSEKNIDEAVDIILKKFEDSI
ncbi:MAG: hypothetical protein U9O94_09160 [Nanoarchaeota archaeon]|nr:hypothetical protein [Nanoarchaeota archaeon]